MKLPEIGQPVVLIYPYHVRETPSIFLDSMCGRSRPSFSTHDIGERIGPETAINILSGITAGELISGRDGGGR